MNKEYCVIIQVAEQISPDDFLVEKKTLKVTSETTVQQIEEWYRKFYKVGLTSFHIFELEQLKNA